MPAFNSSTGTVHRRYRTRTSSFIAATISILAMSACQKSPQVQKVILGGQVHVLPICTQAQIDLQRYSTHTIEIKNLNLRKLDNGNEDWLDQNSNKSPKPANYPAGHGRTRWDISLSLPSATQTSLMTIDLKDTGNDKLEFISQTYAITAGDKDSVDRFCIISQGYTSHHAQILALFDPKLTGNDNLSSINIGVNVSEGNSGYSIPIHVDPNVKNNG